VASPALPRAHGRPAVGGFLGELGLAEAIDGELAATSSEVEHRDETVALTAFPRPVEGLLSSSR
jgi:hypothetical protein